MKRNISIVFQQSHSQQCLSEVLDSALKNFETPAVSHRSNVLRSAWIRWSLMIVCLSLSFSLRAQDIHFSQYYATPMTANPANTGMFNGTYRAGANYRNQWASVTVPYKTFAAYADLSMMHRPFNKYFFGTGLSMVNDVAGDGNLSVTKLSGNGAFHIALDDARSYFLSVGLQASYIQKKIDWSKLYFHSQWRNVDFDRNWLNGETGYTPNFSYFDFQLGAMYSFTASNKLGGFASASLSHAARPKDSFYQDDYKLGGRPQLSAGANVDITDAFTLYPSFYYQNQKNASELLVGNMVTYKTKPEDDESNKIYFGTYLRLKDAWYPVVGYEFSNIRVLLNYDINFSELLPASSGRGALELSIQYIGSFGKPPVIDIPCPRF